jgi:hypothetical protein
MMHTFNVVLRFSFIRVANCPIGGLAWVDLIARRKVGGPVAAPPERWVAPLPPLCRPPQPAYAGMGALP